MRCRVIMILLFLIAPLMFSFSLFNPKSRDYEAIANEIRNKVAKKLSRSHNMDWIGIGGGMMDSVYMLGMSFKVHHVVDKNEAQKLIVDCVEELLYAVNNNEEIRPFLRNYPFTTKNVDIAIYTDYPDGKLIYDPNIGVVSISQSDNVRYLIFANEKKLRIKNQYLEPYQEILDKVKNKSKNA